MKRYTLGSFRRIPQGVKRTVSPGILARLFHHTISQRSTDKTVEVVKHLREWFELCLCVFKVARLRKVHPELSAGSTFTQHIGMLGM